MTRRSWIFITIAVFLSMMNGIARASLQMKLSPVLKESYDNNLFLSKDEEKEGDFIHSAGLLFGVDQSSYYLTSLLNYYIESEGFSKNEEINNVRHTAYLQLKVLPSNDLSFDVKNLFRATEEFDFNIIVLEESQQSLVIERQKRQKRYVDDLYMRMNYQITGKNTLYFDYKLYLEDVETYKEPHEDINSFRIGLDSLYGRMNKNRLSLIFEVKDYAFQWNKIEGQEEARIYAFIGEDKGFETYSFIAASLWDISYKSMLNAYGGILRTEDDNRDSLIDEDYFFTGGLAYKKEFNYAIINLSYDHEISGSGGFGDLAEREVIRLNGTAFFNSYFSVTLSSNFRDNYYPDQGVSDPENDNETLSFLADLSYDNKTRFKATLYYSLFKFKNDYSRQTEESGIADYRQSTIALKTSYNILKYWILKIEYNYTWREMTDELMSNAELAKYYDLSFRRSLITIGIEFNKL